MKRISAFAMAALFALSMSAFADDTKPTDRQELRQRRPRPSARRRTPNCTKKCTGDNNQLPEA